MLTIFYDDLRAEEKTRLARVLAANERNGRSPLYSLARMSDGRLHVSLQWRIDSEPFATAIIDAGGAPPARSNLDADGNHCPY